MPTWYCFILATEFVWIGWHRLYFCLLCVCVFKDDVNAAWPNVLCSKWSRYPSSIDLVYIISQLGHQTRYFHILFPYYQTLNCVIKLEWYTTVLRQKQIISFIQLSQNIYILSGAIKSPLCVNTLTIPFPKHWLPMWLCLSKQAWPVLINIPLDQKLHSICGTRGPSRIILVINN